MPDELICSDCGAKLSPETQGGLCVRCLFSLGLDAEGDTEAAAPVVPITEKAGDRIGRYKLLEKLGEGGGGVVYMAEQEEPIRRRVALKVIKPGMDTRAVIARFQAERQALAMMDHPNIAKVLDVGQTSIGRPFFVMELVKGVRITEYCDQNNLPTRERLALFTQVCHAIQHAHQKSIIHRDIKPSNILVTLYDGVPVPKVIDFGIAKALHQQRLTDLTLFTAFGQFLGTPAYMSPEQAELSGLDIDTRSDIYSLGVLLYELLVGQVPFDGKQLLQAGLDEMRRVIREQEPAKPSTCLSTLAAADLRVVARHRQCDPAKLTHLVRGDLDWIVMKSLEKDRTRRYETANELAAEIGRHLDGEPVLARPPTPAYRVQTFVRRNKGLVAATASIALALVLGIVISVWQWRRADVARRDTTRSNEQLRRVLNQMDSIQLQRAEEYMAEERRLDALPRWALVLRNDPSNRIAAERLMSTLSHRSWARLACPPLEHSNRVTSAMFNRDGTKVVTSSADNTAWVWDALTGQHLAGPFTHAAEINQAGFSPDGRFVVTASKDKTARVWNVLTGALVTESLQHTGDVTTEGFSPDAKQVLTISGGRGFLWNVSTGQRVEVGIKGTNLLRSARFSPDGSRVALAYAGGAVQLWDVASGAGLHQLKHADDVESVAFSPDGQWLVTASSDKTARVWDVRTGQPVGEPLQHQARVRCAEFSPDGQHIVTATSDSDSIAPPAPAAIRDSAAQIWHARTGQKIGPPLKHDHEIRCALFSRDGLRVVTAGWDKTVRVWDARTGKPLGEPLAHNEPVYYAEFFPDDQRVLTASNGKAVLIWDTRPAAETTLPLDGTFQCARFSPDSLRIAVCSEQLGTRVVETLTGKTVTALQQDSFLAGLVPNDVEFSPDGRLVAVATEGGGVGVWDSHSGRRLTPARLLHQNHVVRVRFSHDGRKLVTASWDGTARIWETLTGAPLTDPLRHDDKLTSAEFSPDDQYVLTAGLDFKARIWEARSARLLHELRHEGAVASARFSPDGTRVVTTAGDLAARIWDARTGDLLGTLWHPNAVCFAQFSPDSQRVVTTFGGTGKAQLWDVSHFKPMAEPFREGRTADFSFDGERLIMGAVRSGDVRILDAWTGQRLSEKLQQGTNNRFAAFSPDGRFVLLGTDGHRLQIREAPPAPLPVPAWLPELAEALAGQRFNREGRLEPVRPAELWAVQRRMAAWAEARSDAFYARWAKWFVADTRTRTVFPSSPLTLPQYAQSLLDQGTPEGCRDALLLQPANAVALAAMGGSLTNAMLADWMTRRAVELAPNRFETWSHRSPVLWKAGKFEEAIAAYERAIEIFTDSPTYWFNYGTALERVNRLEDAIRAYGRAVNFIHIKTNEIAQGNAALPRRQSLLQRLGHKAETQEDFLVVKGIPPRPGDAGKHSIELSAFYNVGLDSSPELKGLQTGMQTLAGVRFDIRGWVRLHRNPPMRLSTDGTGIPESQKCRRLHFLHGTEPPVPEGTVDLIGNKNFRKPRAKTPTKAG